MVKCCVAVGCSNRESKDSGIPFHRIPKDKPRRDAWIAAIHREGWTPCPGDRLCGQHFVGGRKDDDPLSPDFVPSIFNFVGKARKEEKKLDRANYIRRKESRQRRESEALKMDAAEALVELSASITKRSVAGDELYAPHAVIQSQAAGPSTIDSSSMIAECRSLREELCKVKGKLEAMTMTEGSFENNDSKVRHCTGLPNFKILMFVVDSVKDFLKCRGSLDPFQQVIITCMRLRNVCSLQLAAYIFQVSKSTVSRVFHDVIIVLNRRLVPALVFWPEREHLRSSLPMSFRHTFPNCAAVIDCFEVNIERATALTARVQTYSAYKNHNTIKYLIAITPQGTVSFVSKGWGGRVSDKHLTVNCGFLDMIQPGDLILADRGFRLEEDIGLRHATLQIPAFTKNKTQLAPLNLETSRRIASQRIHVERVIGLVRNKYQILNTTVPYQDVQCDQYGFTTLDKIVRVAGALVNLCESVVPFE